jgi:hypothetical protein
LDGLANQQRFAEVMMTDVAAEFERCWPWLEASIATGGNTHGKRDVWRAIECGQEFWPAEDCALLSEIVTHPTGLRSFVINVAGGSLGGILRMMPKLEAKAAATDCHRVLIYASRPGWRRVLDGYRHFSEILCKELAHG